MNEKKGRILSGIMMVITVILIVLSILSQTVAGIAVVKGRSMTPAYKDGDIVIYLRKAKTCEYGDVILIRKNEKEDYIKRVIGVPGDTIDIDQRTETIYINNKELKESYILENTKPKDELDYPITLKEGEYFVLGDHRTNSSDSRNFGIVEAEDIEGRELITFGKNRKF